MTVNGPGSTPENNGRRVDTYSRDLSRPDVPDTPFLEGVQKWLLHHSLQLVHGPGEVSYGMDALPEARPEVDQVPTTARATPTRVSSRSRRRACVVSSC